MRCTAERQHQIALDQRPVVADRAVNLDRERQDVIALQDQRLIRLRAFRTPDIEFRPHQGSLESKIEVERDFRDEPGGRTVVLAADRRRITGGWRGIGHFVIRSFLNI